MNRRDVLKTAALTLLPGMVIATPVAAAAAPLSPVTTTGIAVLDNLLAGGFMPGDCVLIQGQDDATLWLRDRLITSRVCPMIYGRPDMLPELAVSYRDAIVVCRAHSSQLSERVRLRHHAAGRIPGCYLSCSHKASLYASHVLDMWRVGVVPYVNLRKNRRGLCSDGAIPCS